MVAVHPLLNPRVAAACAVLLFSGPNDASAQRAPSDPQVNEFVEAIMGGDPERIRELVAERFDVNAPLLGNLTPLLLAVTSGQAASVEALLELGAEVPDGLAEVAARGVLPGSDPDGAIAALLIRRATSAEDPGGHTETEGPEPGMPLPTEAGTYPVGTYSGPCGSSATGELAVPSTWKVDVTLTSIHSLPARPRADPRDAPPTVVQVCWTEWEDLGDGGRRGSRRCEGSHEGVEALLVVMPWGGPGTRAITPQNDCRPVEIAAGEYIFMVESFAHEVDHECIDPACSLGSRVDATRSTATRTLIGPVRFGEAGPSPGASAAPEDDDGSIEIAELELFDIDDEALAYLSLSPHTYYDGHTRVHGTIAVVGEEDDSLEGLFLEVREAGRVVAFGRLAEAAEAELLGGFGPDGRVELTDRQLLFELPSAAMTAVDQARDGTVTLRVLARSARGHHAEREWGAVEKLVRYPGTNRFPPDARDADTCILPPAHRHHGYPCGGDDWARPSVVAVIQHLSDLYADAHGLRWNDFSNMNGGRFPPHTGQGHQTGVAADGTFDGYANRDAAAARRLIEYLSDPTYGPRMRRVLVTFQRTDDDPFWQVVRNATLADGRRARDVIWPEAGHRTHFHLEVVPQP